MQYSPLEIKKSVAEQIKDKHKVLVRDVEIVYKDAALLKEWVEQFAKTTLKLSYEDDFKLKDGMRYIAWHVINELEKRTKYIFDNAEFVLDTVKSEDPKKIIKESDLIAYLYNEIAMHVNIIAFGASLLEEILLSDKSTAEKAKNHNLLEILKDIKNLIEFTVLFAIKLRDRFNKINELVSYEYMNIVK